MTQYMAATEEWAGEFSRTRSAVMGENQRLSVDNKALFWLRMPLSCTGLGSLLWGGRRKPQSYARPAGAVIARLVRLGLVVRVYPPGGQKRAPQYQTKNWWRPSVCAALDKAPMAITEAEVDGAVATTGTGVKLPDAQTDASERLKTEAPTQ